MLGSALVVGWKLPCLPWWMTYSGNWTGVSVPVDSAGLLSSFYASDYDSLLICLPGMGLGDTVLWWLWSFLEDRTQKVVQQDCCLMLWLLVCDVPHGSVLFLMLINICMISLGEVV